MGLCSRQAKHLLGGGIEQEDPLALVDRDDGIHGGGDDPGELSLAVGQRLLGELAFGDVAVAAADADEDADLVKDRHAGMADPVDAAVAVDDAKLHFRGGAGVIGIAAVFFVVGLIVGVDNAISQFRVVKECLGRVAGDVEAGWRDVAEATIGSQPEFPIVGMLGNSAVLAQGFAQHAGHQAHTQPAGKEHGLARPEHGIMAELADRRSEQQVQRDD